MSEALLLVVVPPGRTSMVEEIRAAGFTPVADLARGWEGPVPAGAWVRARATGPIPGTGPVLLVDGETPVIGRATWLERPGPGPTPAGFAGAVLLGGDPNAQVGPWVEAVTSPEEAATALARGASGVLVPEPGSGRRLLGFAEAARAGFAARKVQPELLGLLRAAMAATRPEAPVIVCSGAALGAEGGRDPFDSDAVDRVKNALGGGLGVAMIAGAGREALAAAGYALSREGGLVLPSILRRATGLILASASQGVATLARSLGVTGPLLTVHDGPLGLCEAVLTAETWIRAGRVSRVLLLGAEGSVALGLVLESQREAAARSWTPLARLLAARLSTDADVIRDAVTEAAGVPTREARVIGAREGAAAAALEAELGGRPRAVGAELRARGVAFDGLALAAMAPRPGEEGGRVIFRLAESGDGAVAGLVWERLGQGRAGPREEHAWQAWAEGLLPGTQLRQEGRLWVLSDEVPARIEPASAGEDATDTPTARDTVVLLVPSGPSKDRLRSDLIESVATELDLSPDELDGDMRLGGDLGLSPVARAALLEGICTIYGLPAELDDEVLGDATIDEIAAGLARLGAGAVGATVSMEDEDDAAASGSTMEVLATPAPLVGLPRIPDAGAAPADASVRTLRNELPTNMRVRRPVLVDRPLVAEGLLRGRVVRVLGATALAEALREGVEARGGRLEGEPDAVFDASGDVLESLDGARSLAERPPRDWLCVTRLGAIPGRAGLDLASSDGARAGFTRALRHEWTGTAARVLDIDPRVEIDDAVVLACEELASGDAAVDVYTDGERRRVLVLSIEDFPPRSGVLAGRGAVILAGGTQGLAARLGIELARRGAVRLAVLARTPPARKPMDEEAARAVVEQAIRARGRRPSESRISRGLEPYRAAEEARVNMARMRDAGADVRFFKVDLGDPVAVGEAVAEIARTFGSIDGALLCVEPDEPRPVIAHDTQSFRKTLEPAALGGLALARHLPEEAWLLAVGDLPGRFGAAGRVADCAAVEALARTCLARPRALFTSWAPLADGSATDQPGTVSMEAASTLMVDLVAQGGEGELIVAGTLGERTLTSPHPLLDGIDWDGDAVIVWREASFESDPWLADYIVDGTPQLPVSVGLELMAAAATALQPGARFVGARGLVQHAPCKMSRSESVRIVVRAEALGAGEVRCTLDTERALRPGRTQRTAHMEARLSLGQDRQVEPLPPAFFPEETIPRGQVYRRFFHGTVFQVLGEIGAVASNGLLADATVDHILLAGGLISAPLAFEAAVQAAGLHRMAIEGTISLPERIESLWLSHVPADGTTLDVMVHSTAERYNVDVDGPDGPVLRIRGLRLDDRLALNPADRVPEPDGGWPAAVIGRVERS